MFIFLGVLMLASATGLLWAARPVEGIPKRWVIKPYMQEIVGLTLTALCAAGVTLLILGIASLS
jgi:hypothetical protein